MQPIFVAKKTAWGGVTPLCVLLFWLVIPLIVMICRIVVLKHQTMEFYDDYVIVKSGVLSKNERKTVFPSVLSVSVSQSLWGRICGYGDLNVDVVGKWDVNLQGICNPGALKKILEDKVTSASNIKPIVVE